MNLKTYLHIVVSRFGLKAEGPLWIRVDGLAGGLILVLVCQSDLVAALLLHALRQATDGDLATHTEPVWDRHQTLDQARQQCGNMKSQAESADAEFFPLISKHV